jgi:hypothetical protein
VDRRTLLTTLLTSAAGACILGRSGAQEAALARPKAPFRMLYSNDMTNVLTCVSPFHKAREPFTPQMLQATVDETADTGVDVHLAQPASCWVPWWQSRLYPIAEHEAWWKQHYGVDPGDCSGWHKFLREGGDPIGVFVERCRLRGQQPFVSMRMNDIHHLTFASDAGNRQGVHTICRFYVEHPQWWLRPGRGMDWAVPEVREYRFALIDELCRGYDLEGIELDYQRFPEFFQPTLAVPERRAIMREFIARVRSLLDSTAPTGRRRWLSLRVPSYLDQWETLGLDVPGVVEAGADMLNLSAYYYTEQPNDLVKVRQQAPDAAIYVECCHTIAQGDRLPGYGDVTIFRRTTNEQYRTTAHLSYARGADGMSLFNFVYTRDHGVPGRGPFCEPPFHVIRSMADPSLAAQPPHYYFLSALGNKSRYLPRKLTPGASQEWTLDLAPPTGGWTAPARLRLQTRVPLNGAQLAARFNDTDLSPSADVSEPFPSPYVSMLGTAETLCAWTVSPQTLKPGPNRLQVTLTEGPETDVMFLELTTR